MAVRTHEDLVRAALPAAVDRARGIAGGGAAPPRQRSSDLGMLSSFCGVVLPHCGTRLLVVRQSAWDGPWFYAPPSGAALAAALGAELAAAGSGALSYVNVASVCDRVVHLLGPECAPGALPRALAVAPAAPVIGGAAVGNAALVATAQPGDMPLSTAVLCLEPGESLDFEAGDEAERALLDTQSAWTAWLTGMDAALQVMFPLYTDADTAALRGGLLVADAFAAAVTQLTLLPLVGEHGRPRLALDGAHRVLAALRAGGRAAATALGRVHDPAAAWDWLRQHVAPAAAASGELGSLPWRAAAWVDAIRAGASSVRLRAGAALPLLDLGASWRAGELTLARRFSEREFLLLAFAPTSSGALATQFSATAAAKALQRAGAELAAAMVVRDSVAGRHSVQLLLVEHGGTPATALLRALQQPGWVGADAAPWTASMRQAGSALSWRLQVLARLLRGALKTTALTRVAAAGAEAGDWTLVAPDAGGAGELSSFMDDLGSTMSDVELAELHELLQAKRSEGAALVAGAGTGGDDGDGSASTLHIWVRQSSLYGQGALRDSLGGQVATCSAAAARALACAGLPPPPISLLVEVCSVYEHRPPSRTAVTGLLAQVQPGDTVLVASPDRIARKGSDFIPIIAAFAAKGVAVAAAGIGRLAPLPLLRLDAGGQAGSVSAAGAASSVSTSSQQDFTLKVASVLDGACWETAAQLGAAARYTAYMQRVSAQSVLAPTAGGPVGSISGLLASVLQRVPRVIAFARVSQSHPSGCALQVGGGASAQDMRSLALGRMQSFMQAVIGGEAAGRVEPRVCDGVSAAVPAEENGLMRLLRELQELHGRDDGSSASASASAGSDLQPPPPARAAVLLTTDCRLSRRSGVLRKAAELARQLGVALLVLLHPSRVLDAVPAAADGALPDYVAAALGPLATGVDRGAANEQLRHFHTAARASGAPVVLLPLDVARCSEPLLAALEEAAALAAGSATGLPEQLPAMLAAAKAAFAAAAGPDGLPATFQLRMGMLTGAGGTPAWDCCARCHSIGGTASNAKRKRGEGEHAPWRAELNTAVLEAREGWELAGRWALPQHVLEQHTVDQCHRAWVRLVARCAEPDAPRLGVELRLGSGGQGANAGRRETLSAEVCRRVRARAALEAAAKQASSSRRA
ncbi:hypothetical protein HT031_001838 [Scenedesmus sp. PABB004]|nr:hypothetical protein HT031_001838 [Scenedesmus sp. PABB004]